MCDIDAVGFVHDVAWGDLPEWVTAQARRCLLDTVGAAVGGRTTKLSAIIHDAAAAMYGGRGAGLWFDGREVSPPGAALANGMTTDALDIHDGYVLAKGHAGAAVVPGAVAMLGARPTVPGTEFLTTLVVGYEIALRAGLALHATAGDYHSSGGWNALGCAAMTARRLGLDSTRTQHALGIAEYHGPRSQMMRCLDHPTMVKDGAGWGAMVGVSAGLLAERGFTGAPALTVGPEATRGVWDDLGAHWLIADQYFKPDAVCRWAQPAIEGALAIRRNADPELEQIRHIRVSTFHEATRLSCRRPETTEQAQYSLPFPVAAALVHDRLGPAQLSGAGLQDAAIVGLSERVMLREDPAFNAQFPSRRLARVEIEMVDGTVFRSGEVEARWESHSPPSDRELREKFRWLALTALPDARVTELETLIWNCDGLQDLTPLVAALEHKGAS